MALAKYRLKGHESFILREGWITKALFAIDRDPLLFTVSAGADALGVGTNMAKSIRYWMRTAGLTDESLHCGLFILILQQIINWLPAGMCFSIVFQYLLLKEKNYSHL